MSKLLHYINPAISAVIKHAIFIMAGIIAICWYVRSGGLEPIVTTLLIIAAIVDFYSTRQVEYKEKRRVLLHALVHELYINLNAINDEPFNPNSDEISKFVVFPRVQNTTLQTCITSGAFVQKKDTELFKLMHSWNQRSSELNNRLNLTEQAMLQNTTSDNIKVWRTRLKNGHTFANVRESLIQLTEHLLKNYKNESGIDTDSVLFPDKPHQTL